MTADVDQRTGDVLLAFRYDAYLVERVKALPARRWNPTLRVWACRVTPPLLELLIVHNATLSPALEELIRVHGRTIDDSRAKDSDCSAPCPAGLAYLPFQRAGIAWAVAHPRCLIADEAGLGKTIMALGAINAQPGITNVLTICPATLRDNWQRESMRWLCRRRHPIEMATMKRAPTVDFVIAHYDLFSRESAAARELLVREWDLVILDESHFLKNGQAARTRRILGQWDAVRRSAVGGLKAQRVYALTGTPILNKPVELWTIAHALAPWEFPYFGPFAKRYCAPTTDEWGTHYEGAAHLLELQERLRSSVMIRRKKSEVLSELPAKRRQVIELDSEGAELVIGRELRVIEERKEWLKGMRETVAAARERGDKEDYAAAVAALRRGIVETYGAIASLRHDTARAKLPHAISHLWVLLAEHEKLVIFAHHHDVVTGLMAEFEGMAVALTGETPMGDRQGIVDRFQTDPGVRVFVGSLTAAGFGLTLTAASLVVFVELDWVPAIMTQCEDRCHRIGQKGSVLVQHLVFAESLDAIMAHRIVKKQEILDQAMDEDEAALPVLPVEMDEVDSFQKEKT